MVFAGNLESFRSMADRFDVSKSKYHYSIKKIGSALVNEIMSDVIKWPTGNKIRDTSEAFSNMAGLQNVMGAVDGCHIPIKAPKDSPNAYYNRKMFHSLVLLATCDSNLQFTYVWTGHPGSTHDATILRSSELYQQADNLIPRGYYILGDSAFPLLDWLVTPFRDYGNLNREQRQFNICHSRTRQVIERCFGRLKCRFRRLYRFDASDMHFMVDTILSACVLHNLCLELNEEEFEVEGGEGEDADNECSEFRLGGHQMGGVRLRQNLMQQLQQLN